MYSFFSPSGSGDGGGYAFVPANPMDLANGYTSNSQMAGDSATPDIGEAFLGGLAEGFNNVSGFIRSVGDFFATPYDWAANSTSSPTLAAVYGFFGGLTRTPYNLVANLVNVPALVGSTTNTFGAYYNAGGGGVNGTLLGLSGVLGTAGAAESLYQVDIPTGRGLTGDETFDRGVLGAGAIGGIVWGGFGASSTLSARLAAAAKNGSVLSGALLTEIPTFGLNRVLNADLLYLPRTLGGQLWNDFRYAPRNGMVLNPFAPVNPAELRPYGGPGGGHHVPAQSGFRAAAGYNANEALAIPNAELAGLGVSHPTVTGAQQTLYRAFAQTGQPLTWEAMHTIETQALIRGGMNAETASATVSRAIQALKDAGVSGATRIPWGG